jgi:deoxyribonuclease-4
MGILNMPYLGAHMSAAGGPSQALLAAKSHGMTACQLFTKNNKQWSAPAITQEAIREFRKTKQETGITCCVSHASYLINLASRNDILWNKSLTALKDELHRADQLDLSFVVVHPGAASDEDIDFAVKRVATAVNTVLTQLPKMKTKLLLETTAGQGKSLGHTFDQLGQMLRNIKQSKKIGICLDTCHVFAAGYALSPRANYQKTITEFDKEIGLDRLAMIHVNDSVKSQGSRVDRHAHLGEGAIGLVGLKNIISDRRFIDLPMILETPKGERSDGTNWDDINMKILRKLFEE